MSAAYTYWPHLPHLPHRLLVYMALVSLDRDEPPRFWGGREDLARALGRWVPREPDDDDHSETADAARKARRAAFEAVRAGLKELKAAGAVTVARGARQGTRAEYRLHLQGQAQPGAHAQAQPGSAAQDKPAGRTGSACTQAQTQPWPKEESGGLRTLGGQDPVGLSRYSLPRPPAQNSGEDQPAHLRGSA